VDLDTIEEALRRASFCLRKADIDQPRLEAEMLLAFCLGLDRLQLQLRQEYTLEAEDINRFNAFVQRRCSGEPFAYIRGSKDFYGRCFVVNSHVLIPRPETEMIIDIAVRMSRVMAGTSGRGINCLDLGTGSGVLAITMALEIDRINIWAVDVSEEALRVAGLNAGALKADEKITFCLGSYYDALAGLSHPGFDIIIANPPYISLREMVDLPVDVREYEPGQALCGGEDGLDGYRLILGGAAEYINRPGVLILEIGDSQQKAVERMCFETGLFDAVTTHKDLAGRPRAVEAIISRSK
jgi:release factor glutamine methyltransferase